ncbi:MAG: PAS and helix-turn-helix domain-containing protein [Thermoanaerobaculia bacterium]
MPLVTDLVPDPEQLFAVLSMAREPVMATDRRNRIVFWNDAAEQLLGYSREEMVGASCAGKLQGSDAFGNRYCSDHCPIVEMAARHETVRHFNLQLRAKDRSSVGVNVTIMNLDVSRDNFYLVHVLIPADEAPETAGELPRPPLALVRESLDARVRSLTQREHEVLRMMATGMSTHEIATSLHIAPLTARNHIQKIMEKIEVHSKAEAVAFAFQKKLV